MCKKTSEQTSFLSGAILGGVIGATIALLLTPQTGKKTRKVVLKEGKKLLKNVSEQLDEVKESKISPTLKEIREELDEKFEVLKKELEEKFRSVRSKATSKTKSPNSTTKKK